MMKKIKSVFAFLLALCMITAALPVANAADKKPTPVLSATYSDGVVTLTVCATDAQDMTYFDTPVKYDSKVLKIKGAVKDGPYKAQYEACGESIISGYNTAETGTILPGIAIGNRIYNDATFRTMFEDNEVEGSPVSTKNMVIFTAKFTVTDTSATSTTFSCGSATTTVTLKKTDNPPVVTSGATVLSATVADGTVTLSVARKDATGLTYFDHPVKYDSSVLKVKGAVKDGPYKAQYEACGESIISGYNTTEAGTILPGIAMGKEIYSDTKFKAMCAENDVSGTPVSTKNMVLFTVKFSVINSSAKTTTFTCDDASCTVQLAGRPAFIYGDVDNNKKLTVDDARLCLRASVKLENYAAGTREFLASDVDDNGKITVDDARLILRVTVILDDMSAHHIWKAASCTTPKTCKDCGVTVGSSGVHSWNSGKTTTAATCTAGGVITYTCTLCGTTKTSTTKALGHNYTSATCTTPGKCTRCGATGTAAAGHKEVIDPAVMATYSTDGKTEGKHCSVCGKVLVAQKTIPRLYSEVTKKVTFGSYPQSLVTDYATRTELLNLWSNSKAISYNYWYGTGASSSASQSDAFMKYQDVVYNGEKYRIVIFSKYRPKDIDYKPTSGNSYQDDNGYYTGTYYCFKFEPLQWTVLDKAKGLIICDKVIDGAMYYQKTDYTSAGNYIHNYPESSIRGWLNYTFYNTAFSDYEKSYILNTTNDNYGHPNYGPFNYQQTTDKAFLLSYSESEKYFTATTRLAKATDYAKCQGVAIDNNNCQFWLLRTAGYRQHCVTVVSSLGSYDVSYTVSNTYGGTRPAIRIKF